MNKDLQKILSKCRDYTNATGNFEILLEQIMRAELKKKM